MSHEGWSWKNGAWSNDDVKAKSERGAEFYLNLEDHRLDMDFWKDGTNDYISMRPVGILLSGPMEEITAGWKWPIEGAGSQHLYLVDFQLTKYEGMFDDFTAPGLALVIGGIPISELPAQGEEYRPERVRFFGPGFDDTNFAIQQPFTQQEIDDGYEYLPGVDGSIQAYSLTKCNNRGHKKYGVGKKFDMRALMVGHKQGQITGWAFGKFVPVDGMPGYFDKVFIRDAQFDADMTRNNIGNPITISVSADVGETAFGSTLNPNGGMHVYGSFTNTVEGETVESISIAAQGVSATPTFTMRGAVYDWDSGDGRPNNQLANSLQDYAASGTTGVDEWFTHTYAGSVVIPSLAASPNVSIASNLTSTGEAKRLMDGVGSIDYENAGWGTPFSSPYAGTSTIARTYSQYITTAAAVTAPITTNAAVDPIQQGLGDTVTITATITDGDAVTESCEAFFGTDPGEGSAPYTGVLSGGGSPWTATFSNVPTSALPLGLNVASVRGYDGVGWGAVDTANLDLQLAAPQNTSAVGGDETVTLTRDDVLGATGYIWWFGTSAETITSQLITNVNPFVHTGRTNGVEYFYQAQATNPASAFPFKSDAISAVAGAPSNKDAGKLIGGGVGGKVIGG